MVDMSSTPMNTKIRRVRCPRCRKVLPELPEIPVYQCGGCGTILQAKNRKTELRSSDVTNSAENYDRDSESDVSNQETALSLGSSPESDRKGEQFETEKRKLPGIESSVELCRKNETEFPEAEECVEEGSCRLPEDANGHGDEVSNHSIHWGGSDVADELPSSTELDFHGSETSSPESTESVEQNGHVFPSVEDGREYVNETVNCSSQQPGTIVLDELRGSAQITLHGNERSSQGSGEFVEQSEQNFQSTEAGREYGNVSDETQISAEISHQGNEKSSQEAGELAKHNEHQYALKQGARTDGDESPNHSSPGPGDRTTSDVLVNSGELRLSESEVSSPDLRGPIMKDDDRTSLNPNIEKYATESGDDGCEQSGDGRPSTEIHSLAQFSHPDTESPSPGVQLNTGKDMSEQYPSQDQTDVPLTGQGTLQNELASCSRAHREVDDGSAYHSEGNNGEGKHKFSGQIESSEDIEFAGGEASSGHLVPCDNIADVNEDSVNLVESSLISTKGDAVVAAQSPSNECIVPENLSPYEKYIEQSQRNVLGFDRVGSDESLVSLPTIPRHALGAMSKSPTKIYYGGDTSGSSYDGNNDQIADWTSYIYKGKFKAADLPETHRSRKMDGFRARKMQDSRLEMRRDQRVSPSVFAEKNDDAMNGQEWSHDELLQRRGKSGSVRRMKFGSDYPMSGDPYISRSSHLARGNRSPSRCRENVFQHHSRPDVPGIASYAEPDKTVLLRMVYELEDKLNRAHTPHWMKNDRVSSEVHGYERDTLRLYDDIETEGNIYTDYGSSIHHDSFRRGVGWLPQSDISRKSYSGEAAVYRHQVDCLCSQCYPHGLQRPRHLPPRTTPSKFQHAAPQRRNHPKSFTSFPLAPQLHTSSRFSSWGEERKSNDHQHAESEQKRSLLREKYLSAKRHIRPMVSGAPIVTCFHCSELLQLPVDFLVYKKRCHQLRCNSCNQVLKFSLKKSGHLVPYDPNAPTPPPSEMGDNSVPANTRTWKAASNHNQSPRGEPVSFSDDYDPSYAKSYSTEREHSVVSAASCSHLKKKMASIDSNEAIGFRIKNSISRNSQRTQQIPATSRSPHHPIFRNSGSRNGNGTFETIETTSSETLQWRGGGALCSEIEELPAPLHKLMGYSSPHYILYASTGDHESEGEVNSGRSVSG